jgi:hypothetical protein
VILQGDTISEAIAATNGMRTIVQVIADLVTPDILWIGMNVPGVPAYLMAIPSSVILNNRYLVDASTIQTGIGYLLNFSSPIPGNVTVSILISDDFKFVGNLSTLIYINTTTATAYTGAVLPAGVSLSGLSYTIWTNRTISVVRDTHYRWQRSVTTQYFPATDKYETTVSFQNTVGTQWRNITLFIAFQNGSKVDNRSVRVYDMNNTVDLTEGVHYVLSKTGVHMWFAVWNASLWRGFEITYTTVNETSEPVHILVNTLGDSTGVSRTWNGGTFYFCNAEWTNDRREAYIGALYITLDLTVSVDPTTIKVLDKNGSPVISAIISGNTIIIPTITVPVGEKVNYTILFDSAQPTSPTSVQVMGVPILYLSAAVGVFSFVIGALFISFRKEQRMQQFGRIFIAIAVLMFLLSAVVIIYYIGISG